MIEVLVSVGLLAAALLGVYFGKRNEKVRLTPRQYDTLYSTAQMAVKAAEQLSLSFNVSDEAKYAFAQSVVQDTANRLGVKLSGNEIVAFIHAALKEQKDLDMATALAVPPIWPEEVPEESQALGLPDFPREGKPE